jgi:hypothetical protein
LFGGYYAIYYPSSTATAIFAYLPFTSPVVMLVKLGQGFDTNTAWQIYLALFILFCSAFVMFWVAGKIYKNGLLQFGHRLKLTHLLKWLRKA